jgi:hypothetical protein
MFEGVGVYRLISLGSIVTKEMGAKGYCRLEYASPWW